MNRHLRAALDRGLVSEKPKSAAAPRGAMRPPNPGFRLFRKNSPLALTAQVVAADLAASRALIAETNAVLAAAARPKSAPMLFRSIGPRGEAMKAAAAAPKAAPAPSAPKLSVHERGLLLLEAEGRIYGMNRVHLALLRSSGRVPAKAKN